jgi:L-iditol 2-dehydrogenase
LGHEFSGVIEDAGENTDKSLIGKKITCAPYVSCYNCGECDKGLYELCTDKDGISSGTFAEYITVPLNVAKKGLVILNEESDMKELSLAEPLACVLNSVRKINFKPGQNVLVMGAGPMGLIHVEVFKKFGANKIFVSEFDSNRLKIAESLGAEPINSGIQSIHDTVFEKTNGRGVDHIIVAVGVPAVVEEAFKYASSGTTINIFGGLANGSRVTIDPNMIHYNEVRLVGSFGFSPEDFRMAAKLLESGRVSLKNIVSHEFGIDDIENAFKMSLNLEAVKIVIKM